MAMSNEVRDVMKKLDRYERVCVAVGSALLRLDQLEPDQRVDVIRVALEFLRHEVALDFICMITDNGELLHTDKGAHELQKSIAMAFASGHDSAQKWAKKFATMCELYKK